MDVTLKPLGDRVIVKPCLHSTREDQTKSGLILPNAKKEEPLTGIVLSIGPGHLDKHGNVVPVSEFIKIGACVYFGKYTGVEVKQKDNNVLILHEDEIYGVVE